MVTDASPYRRDCAASPIAVVAVGDALFSNSHAHLPSLASRASICDLTITSRRHGLEQIDFSRIKSIQRLTVAYSELQDDSTTFFVPGGLDNLSSLTCIHNCPSFRSSIPSIRSLSLSVRAGDHQSQSLFGRLLRYTPNLESLSLYWSPILSILRRTEHQSLSTV